MTSLKTHNLNKHFEGVKAVQNLSVQFEPGKVTGVIGPNGSGKSTLINALTGVTPITSGNIVIAGKEKISQMNASETIDFGITRTFQEVRLFEQMTVLDNILVVTTARGPLRALFEKHSKYHLAIAEQVLKQVGMWQFKDKDAVQLSYGQRKLLEIARILAMKEIGKADIIFFDEPFAGLFPEMRKVVVSVIQKLKSEGATVVLVEHNMDLIRELSDTVIVMDSGGLLAEGKVEHVLAQRDVIEAYLGE